MYCLAMIVALGAILRLWQAGESLWIDELHTSWAVNGTLSDVLPRAAMGNQSPLYFWGLWLLVQMTGQSEWTLRLPSLIAGIALPAAVFFFVGRSFRAVRIVLDGPKGPSYIVALAAALLVAIDPTCIFYAQEARPYAWVMLLSVVEIVLLKRLIERPTVASRLIFLANSLVLFYLHYTAAIFLVGFVVLLPMLVRLTGSTYRTKHLIIDLVLAALLAAPGVVQMSDIFERRTNWEAFVDKPSWQALFTEVPFSGWAMAGSVVVALVVLVPRLRPGNGLTRGSASSAPPTTSLPNLLWYCVLLASILIPLLLSWSVTALDAARIFYVRYLVALIPLAAAATCLAIAWIPWRAVQVTALAALAGWHLYGGGMIQQFVRDGRFLVVRNEDWRGAVDHLNGHLPTSPAGLVMVDSGLIEAPWKRRASSKSALSEDLQYLTFPLRAMYEVAVDPSIISVCPDVMHAGRVVTSWDFPEQPREVWLVIRGNDSRARQRIAEVQHSAPFVVLVPEGQPRLIVAERHRFGTVHVVRFQCHLVSPQPVIRQPQ